MREKKRWGNERKMKMGNYLGISKTNKKNSKKFIATVGPHPNGNNSRSSKNAPRCPSKIIIWAANFFFSSPHMKRTACFIPVRETVRFMREKDKKITRRTDRGTSPPRGFLCHFLSYTASEHHVEPNPAPAFHRLQLASALSGPTPASERSSCSSNSHGYTHDYICTHVLIIITN